MIHQIRQWAIRTLRWIFYRLKHVFVPRIRYLDEPFLQYLTYVNAGMLEKGNVFCIDHVFRNLRSTAPVVEIGAFAGLSTNIIAYLKKKHGLRNRFITVDPWILGDPETRVGNSPIPFRDYNRFVREDFVRNVRRFNTNDLPAAVELVSDAFFEAWRRQERVADLFGGMVQLGGPIGFCYIDGNHRYEFAKRDFENCDLYLEAGGYVLFDDSSDGSDWAGIIRLMGEIRENPRYRLVMRNPNYLFQKQKA